MKYYSAILKGKMSIMLITFYAMFKKRIKKQSRYGGAFISKT